ncbi:eCIS core domain-containing protein [Palaeococcus sp. (in: euryarchaeotes)]
MTVPKKALAFLVILFVIILAAHHNSPPSSLSNETLGKVAEIEGEVEEIRNLTFKQLPDVIVVNREWALSEFSSQANLEELKMWEDIYKMTLLVPPSYNYTRTAKGARASWIAATVGNKMYIIEENFVNTGETAYRVIAHELTHVLQKQYFDPKYPETLDGRLAITSLIEGDADLVADMYCGRHNITINKITTLPLEDPPMAINFFPYVYGDKFVRFLYEKGGWTLVNFAYKAPPLSTEQVIHPQKYLFYEKPKEVYVDVPGGYKIIHEDRMGEFYIYLLITSHLGEERASKAADGWEGDDLILAENDTHEILLWKTLWESEDDAREFYGAMKEIIKKTHEEYPYFVNVKIDIVRNEVLIESSKILRK